jgi:hypothetical protein
VAEKAQSRLDEIFTEAAWIQIEDFSGTHNWTLSLKKHLHNMGLIDEPIWNGRQVGISSSM